MFFNYLIFFYLIAVVKKHSLSAEKKKFPSMFSNYLIFFFRGEGGESPGGDALFFSIISTSSHGFRLPSGYFLPRFRLPSSDFLPSFRLPSSDFLPSLGFPLASCAASTLSQPAAFGVGACACGSTYLIDLSPCLRYFLTLYIYMGRFSVIYLELI